MSPPTRKRLVTASLEPEDVAYLESLPGTLSQNIRQAVSHGCAGLRGESLAPEHLAELRQICERMEATTRRTTTGNLFVSNPDALDLAGMAPFDIAVSSCGLLATAPEQALIVSTAEHEIALQGSTHPPVIVECDAPDLLAIASNFLAATLRQAEQPERVEIGLGLAVQRVGHHMIHLEVEGVPFPMPAAMALSLASELVALAVRGYDQSWQRREALEQALGQGVPK
jgi:hypothetical protein